jgi:hypothetical protein
LPQALIATFTGAWTMLPDRMPPEWSVTAVALDPPGLPEPFEPPPALSPHLPPPTVFFNPPAITWLSQALIGMLIGAWTVLPDRMPPEWLVVAVADEPLFDPPGAPAPPQVEPPTVFFAATPSTWLVHRFRPRSIGIWTVLPDRMPPEFFTVLLAAAPAPDAARGAVAALGAFTSGARTLMGVLTLDGDA